MAASVESMAYTGETPWHGLGVKVPGDLRPEEMLRLAGLDWTVSKRRLIFDDTDFSPRIVASKKMLARDTDDAELSIVPSDWEPIQNHEAFEVFTDFVKAGHMTMETAGSLRGGKIVWGLARTNENFQVFGDDVIQGYFLFSNPHMNRRDAVFGGTSIRVVCANTHNLALKQGLGNEVRFGHRWPFNVERAKEAVAELHIRMDNLRNRARFLAEHEYSDKTLESYFAELFPYTGKIDGDKIVISKRAREALELVEKQPGAELRPYTWWQAYNAVSYMTDHVIGRSRDQRLHSAWFGRGRNLKARALGLANEYAKVAQSRHR